MKSKKDFIFFHRYAFGIFLVCAFLTLGLGYVAFGPGIGDRIRNLSEDLPPQSTKEEKTLFFANESEENRGAGQANPSNVEEQEDYASFTQEPRLFLESSPISLENTYIGENQLQLIVATLRIPVKEFIVAIPKGSTVYDMMKIVAETEDFQFKGKEFSSGLGFFIEEINEVRENPQGKQYWIYYVNGKKAKAGVSNVFLEQNDIVEWRYENAEY